MRAHLNHIGTNGENDGVFAGYFIQGAKLTTSYFLMHVHVFISIKGSYQHFYTKNKEGTCIVHLGNYIQIITGVLFPQIPFIININDIGHTFNHQNSL